MNRTRFVVPPARLQTQPAGTGQCFVCVYPGRFNRGFSEVTRTCPKLCAVGLSLYAFFGEVVRHLAAFALFHGFKVHLFTPYPQTADNFIIARYGVDNKMVMKTLVTVQTLCYIDVFERAVRAPCDTRAAA